jgi:hypothetical protein
MILRHICVSPLLCIFFFDAAFMIYLSLGLHCNQNGRRVPPLPEELQLLNSALSAFMSD